MWIHFVLHIKMLFSNLFVLLWRYRAMHQQSEFFILVLWCKTGSVGASQWEEVGLSLLNVCAKWQGCFLLNLFELYLFTYKLVMNWWGFMKLYPLCSILCCKHWLGKKNSMKPHIVRAPPSVLWNWSIRCPSTCFLILDIYSKIKWDRYYFIQLAGS